jgi:uncharacterized protein
VSDELLLPQPDEDTEPFWTWCARGELRVQRCAACGTLRFPPRPMCFSCTSLDHDWEPLSGHGTIWSFAVAHPPVLPAYQQFAPYPVVVVQLAEQESLRMVGNVVAGPGAAINSVDPATLEIGLPVEVDLETTGDPEIGMPRWIPVG